MLQDLEQSTLWQKRHRLFRRAAVCHFPNRDDLRASLGGAGLSPVYGVRSSGLPSTCKMRSHSGSPVQDLRNAFPLTGFLFYLTFMLLCQRSLASFMRCFGPCDAADFADNGKGPMHSTFESCAMSKDSVLLHPAVPEQSDCVHIFR